MRATKLLLSTLKEIPADAEITSHRLMLRAGMIRKLSSGIFTWLPLGVRVLKKVEQIIREEMNNIGAQEILMPSIQPAELWQESGRWDVYGPLLLKISDRNNRQFCYGPTHEEVITALARNELQSYKQLPLVVYQIQTKFRDEIRPRFGVMRAREFLMKDAYSFDLDSDNLQKSYNDMFTAYSKIFSRLGVKFRSVLADNGDIGGSISHEFHVLAKSGEDKIAYNPDSDYAANINVAPALSPKTTRPKPTRNLKLIDTPNQKTITAICAFLKIPPQQTVKSLIVHGRKTPFVALLVRGDHELNITKAEKLLQIAVPITFANEQEVNDHIGCNFGSIGPVKLNMPIVVDHSVEVLADFVAGANQEGKHHININWGRDANFDCVADIRNVIDGDPSPNGTGSLVITRGIEVGHIFQLGNKYSKSMKATVLNKQGQAVEVEMGCYGIGISRIVAAAIEQSHDERGIIWPKSMAPFDITIIPINMRKSNKVKQAAETLYKQLTNAGFEVLFDDRDERAGVMFSDTELIGIPHRLVISEKNLDKNLIEYRARCDTESTYLNSEKILNFLQEKS